MIIIMAPCKAVLTPFPALDRALERFSEALVIGSRMGRSKTAAAEAWGHAGLAERPVCEDSAGVVWRQCLRRYRQGASSVAAQ